MSGAYGVTPSEVLSQVSNKLSGMTAMEFTDSGTEYSVVVEDVYKRQVQGSRSGTDSMNIVSIPAQNGAEQPGQGLIVLHDQNCKQSMHLPWFLCPVLYLRFFN